jgi:glycosyltransferase involved in cell wall biosynthesis
LQAVAKFKATRGIDHSPVKFVVIGDGNLRQKLAGMAATLGLADDVIFAGSRKDPENFYAGLDAVALTSKNEGTPLTLIEAMANGIPVISTAVGGVVDLLGERDREADRQTKYQICRRGISVVPNDPDAFAAGLERLVSDANLRKELGARGREFVVRNYSRERLLDDIRALYRSLTPSVRVSQTASAAVTRF